jgi:hypothetical protein
MSIKVMFSLCRSDGHMAHFRDRVGRPLTTHRSLVRTYRYEKVISMRPSLFKLTAKPKQLSTVIRPVRQAWTAVVSELRNDYEPARHYMRGAGPKTLERQARATGGFA